MHIAPYDNGNKPIVDAENSTVPLNYFNIVKLKKGEAFTYRVPGYETCIVPATGTVDVDVESVAFVSLGSCLLYTSPSPRDVRSSRMPSSA